MVSVPYLDILRPRPRKNCGAPDAPKARFEPEGLDVAAGGLGGAVSPPGGSRGAAPENFGILTLLDALKRTFEGKSRDGKLAYQ